MHTALIFYMNASYRKAVQEHMSLFKEEVWKHTMVLFTRGDWLGVKTVEERIESEEGLQWLVEKCGHTYHVLDNTKRSDETQVTELLEKIEEMWAGNKDPHYEVDLGRADQMIRRKEDGQKVAKRIRQTSKRQERILRELFIGERQHITDMRFVIVGRKDSGKSTIGNRILFKDLFASTWIKKEFQDQRGTTTCVKHKRNISGVDVSVVEAPGWFTDLTIPDWLKGEVLRSVSMCAPGPHAFLLAVPISKAFTKRDYQAVVEVLMPFGERVWRHCMVIFTWADWLNNRSIEDHIGAEGQALKQLVEKCGYRYHAISSRRFGDGILITELYRKIIDMITRNKGHYFAAEDKKGKKKKPKPTQQEEWDSREQELIDRMLKAVAEEPEEPPLPAVKMTASFDGAFVPSMSGDVPSEVGSTFWSQGWARVAEWRSNCVKKSDVTSGVGSMTTFASYMDKLDEIPLIDKYFPEKDNMKLVTLHGRVSTDIVETQRRHSF